jgi:hypothetical protein
MRFFGWVRERVGLNPGTAAYAVVGIVSSGAVLLSSGLQPKTGDDPWKFWLYPIFIGATWVWLATAAVALLVLVLQGGLYIRALGLRLRIRNPFYLTPAEGGRPTTPAAPTPPTVAAPAPDTEPGAVVAEIVEPVAERTAALGDVGDEGLEVRLSLVSDPNFILVKLRNDGPPDLFRAEVVEVSSPNFHERAERHDWPWALVWHRTNLPDQNVPPASTAELRLVTFDAQGAARHVRGQGGAAFVFGGTGSQEVRVYGRLNASTLDELKEEVLTVTFRVHSVGENQRWAEHKVRFRYQGKAEWADEA